MNGTFTKEDIESTVAESLEDLKEREEYESTGYHPAWNYQALQMSMSGYNIREIAAAVQKHFATVYRFLHSPWALNEIQRVYDDFAARRAATILDPVERFNSKVDEKIALLDELTKHEDPKVALAAIKEWINHSIGSPVKRTEITVEHSLDKMGTAQLRFIKDHGRMPLPEELKQLQIEEQKVLEEG